MAGASPEGSSNEEPKWYLKCLFSPACSILSQIYCTMWYDTTETKPKIFGKSILVEAPVYTIQDGETGMTILSGSYSTGEQSEHQTSSHLVKQNLMLVEPRPMAEKDAGSGQTTALSVCELTGESDWKALTRVVGT